MKLNENEINILQATTDDVEDICRLMMDVYEKMEDKSLFICDDADYVRECLSTEGFGVKACDKNGKLIGFFFFKYPMLSEDNLGRDISMEESELEKVVHMESAVVDPEYRGNGIQSKMLTYAENLIDKSRFKYFMATVSPYNPASYKSLEKNNFVLKVTKIKYHGVLRRIYFKEV